MAEQLRRQRAADVPLSFVCADAMDADVSRAMVVYNEVWDEALTSQLFEKLGRELMAGAIVINNHDKLIGTEPHRWKGKAKPVLVETAAGGTTVYVFERTKHGASPAGAEL